MEYLTGAKQDEWIRESFPRRNVSANWESQVENSKRRAVNNSKRSLAFCEFLLRMTVSFSADLVLSATAAADYYVESLPGIGPLAAHPT
jgi:hypothetical protein